MIQTITDHNVNADHFFNWMEQHWKYYVGSVPEKRAMLCMFEVEAPSGEFTLPGRATNDGEPHAYTDFYRQWFETEDGDDYQYIHGSRIRRGWNDAPRKEDHHGAVAYDGASVSGPLGTGKTCSRKA